MTTRCLRCGARWDTDEHGPEVCPVCGNGGERVDAPPLPDAPAYIEHRLAEMPRLCAAIEAVTIALVGREEAEALFKERRDA